MGRAPRSGLRLAVCFGRLNVRFRLIRFRLDGNGIGLRPGYHKRLPLPHIERLTSDLYLNAGDPVRHDKNVRKGRLLSFEQRMRTSRQNIDPKSNSPRPERFGQ